MIGMVLIGSYRPQGPNPRTGCYERKLPWVEQTLEVYHNLNMNPKFGKTWWKMVKLMETLSTWWRCGFFFYFPQVLPLWCLSWLHCPQLTIRFFKTAITESQWPRPSLYNPYTYTLIFFGSVIPETIEDVHSLLAARALFGTPQRCLPKLLDPTSTHQPWTTLPSAG